MIVRRSLAAALARIEPLPRRNHNGGGGPPAEDRRTLAIGIRFRLGHPSAEIIPGLDGRLVARELRRRVPHLGELERAIAPYAAVVGGGRLLHVTAQDPHPPHGYAELGAFWQYLSQELSNRGGIRAERLLLYLAEYSWRYRWRRWSLARRVATLEKLIDPAVEVAPTDLWGSVEPPAAGGGNLSANV